MCAGELIGVTQANTEAWVRVYRALDHGFAKNALSQKIVQTLGADAKMFADAFIELQEKRHAADYDPRPFPVGRRATQGYVQLARTAITALDRLSAEKRRIMATVVLFKGR
jgi:hypothetical protein